MTYKELLELAAKAAGMPYPKWNTVHNYMMVGLGGNTKEWNPLIDDADALRLAVKLGIDLEWHNDGRVAAYRHANANGNCFTAIESTREDRYTAARLAICHVAAEIGRGME